MIPVALIFAAGGAALTLVVLWLARSASLEYAETRQRLLFEGTQTLAYDVPDGQDPAAVRVALRHAGYDSAEDSSRTSRRVLVACHSGRFRDRPKVRQVIASVGASPAGAVVRFADEPEEVAS